MSRSHSLDLKGDASREPFLPPRTWSSLAEFATDAPLEGGGFELVRGLIARCSCKGQGLGPRFRADDGVITTSR